MALMLDTCGLLSLAGLVRKRLSGETLQHISTADAVYVSACSMFEIAIKHKKQGLDLGMFPDARSLWNTALTEYDLTDLPVSNDDFFQSVKLPDHHADPFDRIIVAQTLKLRISLVTFDGFFRKYGVSVLE
jgi:PIN domain nuclease of toxin-antitoxin system